MIDDTKKAELIAQLKSIECQLSPENLTCDGELPMSSIRRRSASLRSQRRYIIAQLGYQPTNKELWGI